MSNVYNSAFASHINGFIDMKRSLGYKYIGEAGILREIDRYAIAEKQSGANITRPFAEKWCSRRPGEAERTVYGRVIVFMQFASYLRDLGVDSYIPPRLKHPNDHLFNPYVFTHEEMGCFFVAVDNLRLKNYHRQSVIFALPLFFRFLYGTGVRLNEATGLLNKDIDLDNNCFVVKDSKNGQQRIVPISKSLSDSCKEYVSYRNRIGISTQPEDHFFTTLRGVKLYQSVIYSWFKKAILTAGIPHSGDLKGPRIHDLRHTFAVHSIAAMAEAGLDLYVSLPVLSVYLGHQSLRATERYVRLTADFFPDIMKDIELTFLDVFPKYEYHETD